jgi:hypothetical protein
MQQQHPNAIPYAVYVNGEFTQIIWVPSGTSVALGPPPGTTPPPDPAGIAGSPNLDPYSVALDVYARVPLPDIQIKITPDLGLVAHPSKFWIEGYDGRPFGTSRSVYIPPAVGDDTPLSVVPRNDPRRLGTAFTVEVELSVPNYRWGFGDGGSIVTPSLGQAFPALSDIQHTYEQSSYYYPDGYPVWVTVEYQARWRVNGGAWQPLPSTQKTYTRMHQVQEAQPVLVSH